MTTDLLVPTRCQGCGAVLTDEQRRHPVGVPVLRDDATCSWDTPVEVLGIRRVWACDDVFCSLLGSGGPN